jgi:PhoH-like ATPase
VQGVPWGSACDIDGLIPKARLDDPSKTGIVRIEIGEFPRPHSIREDKPDNRIIAVAYGLAQRYAPEGHPNSGEQVVFVSKDLNARIKADVLGLTSEDFENAKVDADALYSGYTTLDAESDLIDELYKDRMLPIPRIQPTLDARSQAEGRNGKNLYANQFVILKDADDENHTGLARRLGETDHLIPVTAPRKPTFGILPRNLQQTMAMDLLLDDEVRMVTLMGGAGTGKTLLAVAAGMAKVFNEERYDKLLVARPIMPMGRDIGYLPGSKDDKLSAWMQRPCSTPRARAPSSASPASSTPASSSSNR